MADMVRNAHSSCQTSKDAVREVLAGLEGADPRLVVVFASPQHDGKLLTGKIHDRFPRAEVLGCTTCGEFTDKSYTKGGVAVMALGEGKVSRCAAELVTLGDDVPASIGKGTAKLAKRMGKPLKELDTSRHIGLVLCDGAHMQEEKINEALGNVAPMLGFVGGSAGDNLQIKKTWEYLNGEASDDGAVLAVLEMEAPFSVLKTAHCEPTGVELVVTRADPAKRLVFELNGRPAKEVFAEATGVPQSKLDLSAFMGNPLALMIEGKPWLRTLLRLEGDALMFACAVLEGAHLNLMKPGDIVAETQSALRQVEETLGRKPSAAIFFDCAYRMLEVEMTKRDGVYHEVRSAIPHAGFYTHGESWLGHINQTLTGLVIG